MCDTGGRLVLRACPIKQNTANGSPAVDWGASQIQIIIIIIIFNPQ